MRAQQHENIRLSIMRSLSDVGPPMPRKVSEVPLMAMTAIDLSLFTNLHVQHNAPQVTTWQSNN